MSLEGKEKRGAAKRRKGNARDLLCGDSAVLRADRSVTVYGCRKILYYGRESVCLDVGKRRLRVMGEELICTAFTAGTASVEGRIGGVLYCGFCCDKTCPVRTEVEA